MNLYSSPTHSGKTTEAVGKHQKNMSSLNSLRKYLTNKKEKKPMRCKTKDFGNKSPLKELSVVEDENNRISKKKSIEFSDPDMKFMLKTMEQPENTKLILIVRNRQNLKINTKPKIG